MDAPVEKDCENQLGRNVNAIVKGIATQEGFTDISLEVSSASAKGDNYLGVLLRVRITGRRGDKDDDSMSLIVKCMSERENVRAISLDFFENEAYMYSEVLPTFARLQEERGIPQEQQFSGMARWHACDRSDGGISLVMEDMSVQGYRLGDRLTGLDATHCSLVIKELARLHALSFAMRDHHPEEFQKLRSPIKETLFRPGDLSKGMKTHLKKMTDLNTSVLLKNFAPESTYMKRFQEFCSNFNERMVDVVCGEPAEPYAVICHGDCWTNNYLFKYSEDGQIPVAACLIDLQLARYSSPITDIAYFLYCSTQGSVRREIYKSLLSDYYNSFSQFLRTLGSDPEKMFPYAAFKEHERKFSQFGLGTAVLVLHIVLAPADDIVDVGGTESKMDAVLERRASDDRLLRRISDIVVDMVDNDFI